MDPISVEEIKNYVNSHPECKGKTTEQIISIMRSDSEYINLSGDYQYSLFGLDRGWSSYFFEKQSSVSPLIYNYVEGHPEMEGTPEELAAYNFLNNVFKDAETSYDNQRKMEGWISDVVNFYRESFDKPATRAKVAAELKDTREDLRNLEDVLHGRVLYGNDGSEVEFSEMFKTTRGVKFSPQKIQACQDASEEYLRADMINRGIDNLIVNLKKNSQATTKFDRASRFNSSFIQAFNKLGIKDLGTMNAFLEEVNEKYKNHPAVQRYGGGFKIVKLSPEEQEAGLYKSQYAIQRVIPTGPKKGEYAAMTPELEQLVEKELTAKLISVKADMLGIDKNASDSECLQTVKNLHNKYLSAFKDAYGTKELTTLSEQYISAQQQGVAYINMGVSIAAMAAAAFTGGLTSLAATGVAVLQPTQLLERGTDADGLRQEDLLNHGKMMLEQLPWMAIGIGVGKLGDVARSFVKLKGLQSLASKSGQTLDDFVKTMSTAGKLDTGVTKALGQTRLIAETAGVSTEFALDMTSTLALRGDATTEDWVMSFAGALAGSAVNRKLSKMSSPEARVQHLMKTFKDFNLTEVEAKKIVNAMEDSKPLKADYERLQIDPKWTSKYTAEENALIAENAKKIYDFVSQNSEQVFSDYAVLGVSNGSSRIKTFLGVHEKIYRSLDRIDKKIEELSDVDKYNAEKLKPGDEPLTQEMADAKIEKYNIDKYNLIHDFDSVYDTLQDVFGGRMIMENSSDIDKVFQSLLDAIDKSDMEILEINNYQGEGGIPYFSSEQIMQIKQHCHNKGYEVTINSQVDAPKGLEEQYKSQFHSDDAVKPSGYTTCQMNIKHKSGVISEYQIRGKHINDLAESEHIFYDLSQGKDPSKGNPQIKKLLEPLKIVIDRMTKDDKEQYLKYLTEYYKYARMKELDITHERPKLPVGIDSVIDMDNIIAVHEKILTL